MSVIGENLPHSEDIVGCRVVDKKNNFKFELWLKFDANSNNHKTTDLKLALSRLFSVSNSSVSVASHKH